MAQAIADGLEIVSFLLSVGEIGLCENGTSRGDGGKRSAGGQGVIAQRRAAIQPEPAGLLIQEAARASGAADSTPTDPC